MTKHCEYCGDELTCAQCEPNEYVDNLQSRLTNCTGHNELLEKELTKIKEESRKRMLALESLTPSGSEFVGDIKACVDYVKLTRTREFESIKRQVIRRKKADSDLAIMRVEVKRFGSVFLKACAEVAELINRANDVKRDELTLKRLTSADIAKRFLEELEMIEKETADE